MHWLLLKMFPAAGCRRCCFRSLSILLSSWEYRIFPKYFGHHLSSVYRYHRSLLKRYKSNFLFIFLQVSSFFNPYFSLFFEKNMPVLSANFEFTSFDFLYFPLFHSLYSIYQNFLSSILLFYIIFRFIYNLYLFLELSLYISEINMPIYLDLSGLSACIFPQPCLYTNPANNPFTHQFCKRHLYICFLFSFFFSLALSTGT